MVTAVGFYRDTEQTFIDTFTNQEEAEGRFKELGVSLVAVLDGDCEIADNGDLDAIKDPEDI